MRAIAELPTDANVKLFKDEPREQCIYAGVQYTCRRRADYWQRCLVDTANHGKASLEH